MHIAESVTLQLVDEKANNVIGCKTDFWVVCDRKTIELHPLCAIKAKLPHHALNSTAKLDENLAGQMFHSLSFLRQHFGVRAPFGFITTYFTWWICWLPDCDAVAQDPSLSTSVSPLDVPETPELHGAKFDLPQPFARASVPQEDKDAVKDFCCTLASAVWKSLKCGRGEARRTLPSYSLCYHKNAVTWESLNGVTHIMDTMPGPYSQKFFVLGYLGAGSDGKAHIVCNSKGERCVMKHYHQVNGAKQAAEQERSLWKLINGVTTYVRTLNNRIALLMPYLHPVSPAESKDPEIQEQVIKVLESCAQKNYIQSDVAWHHIGWYNGISQPKLLLLDFGHIQNLDPHDLVTRQKKITADKRDEEDTGKFV